MGTTHLDATTGPTRTRGCTCKRLRDECKRCSDPILSTAGFASIAAPRWLVDARKMSASLVSGMISGVVGLAVFLVVHHVWIKPIWFIAPVGLVIALAGGLAIGWAYHYLLPALPQRPLRAGVVFLLITAMLAPGMGLSFTHGPLFDLATAKIPPNQGFNVLVHFCLELVLPACVVGAVVGWWLGRSFSALAATALAALAFALGPGHNIPMFGTNPLGLKGHAIVLVIVLGSSLALVESEAAWARRTSSSAGSRPHVD